MICFALREFEDYPNARNGLQLQNAGTVSRIAVAVDACEPILEMARPPVRISSSCITGCFGEAYRALLDRSIAS